jgi:sugar/nucleoside kinase (ribokinase family)
MICGKAVAQADILIGNDEEFAVLAGEEDGLSYARSCAEERGSIIVYKRGEKGLMAFA